jgi:hypothetical protein
MNHEGSTSFVAAVDVLQSSKMSTCVIGRYDANRRTHQSESHKCRKLDIVSYIHFLTYSCNIVQEFALTITCIRVKNIFIFFS